MLADVFENFKSKCLKIRKPHPIKYFWAPRLAWEAALKNTKVKLDLLTDIDMLLMVEKGIKGRMCHCYIDNQKLIINTWKTIIRIKIVISSTLGCKSFVWLTNVAKASSK